MASKVGVLIILAWTKVVVVDLDTCYSVKSVQTGRVYIARSLTEQLSLSIALTHL